MFVLSLNMFSNSLSAKQRLFSELSSSLKADTSCCSVSVLSGGQCGVFDDSYLVDPASSHMLVSKIKPCKSKYKHFVL